MRVAYLDCIGGISGDMALGALLDAGVDAELLIEGLKTLALPPWDLEIGRTAKHGIAAARVEVLVHGEAAAAAPLLRLPPTDAPLAGSEGHVHSHAHEHTHTHGHVTPPSAVHEHSHTHEHRHEHTHAHEHEHHHEPAREHAHEHSHGHDGAEHDHTGTRTFAEVAAVIRSSGLPEPVKEHAERVYRRLAAAEAAVHGTTLDRVHFHEVGAVDSIVDVVGAVYALHLLGVERVVCSPLPSGHGFVRCAHGRMPVPPPATMELLKGCPVRRVDVEGEMVTPTGAALASCLAAEFGDLPEFVVREVGYGAGRKDFPIPNLLRVVIGESADESAGGEGQAEPRRVTLIEANLDDQSPQLFEAVMEALFAAGALDVWFTPIQMKKNRPAQTLSVLCDPAKREELARILFRETTTLGVRYSEWNRECLEREWLPVETAYGTVRVKVARQDGELRTAAPEYEDCRLRAAEAQVPVKMVQAAAAAAAWELLYKER